MQWLKVRGIFQLQNSFTPGAWGLNPTKGSPTRSKIDEKRTSLESALPVQQPAALSHHAQLPQRGLLATPGKDLWEALFLEKLLAETQTVIELCSLGKGTILLHLEHTVTLPYQAHILWKG